MPLLLPDTLTVNQVGKPLPVEAAAQGPGCPGKKALPVLQTVPDPHGLQASVGKNYRP
jgi:hypothetical protein